MPITTLTEDAKAILLLCGRFGRNDIENAPMLLTLGEYNRVADWIKENRIRPADLLTENALVLLTSMPGEIDRERIKALLSRGTAMALAVERWIASAVWVMCRSDAHYPERLKQHLKKQAPPVLYGVGDPHLLQKGGLAVVGSRNVDAEGEKFTREVVWELAGQGIQIVSGGARGVDQIAVSTAMEAGGTVVCVLADNLVKAAISGKYRNGIREKRVVLLSPFHPEERFAVANAMGRNKHIYALADFALVIASDFGKGGTWAGAKEELKRENSRKVFVRDEANVPLGNTELKKLGALSFPDPPWSTRSLIGSGHPKIPSKTILPRQISIFEDSTSQVTSAPSTVIEKQTEYLNDGDTTGLHFTDGHPTIETTPPNIYKAVLPVLLNALNEWKEPKALCAELKVRKAQLDDWLKQACKDRKIFKKIKPIRFLRK